MEMPRDRRMDGLMILALAGLIAAVYLQTLNHPFTHFDDTIYITENPHVREGFSTKGLAWAFTTSTGGYWNPLTWLSHMLDVELFGMESGGHHAVNMLLHWGSAILLFLALRGMTGAYWRSGFVASLFALHPLHVESVAWAAERKDVLCAFFFLLAVWSYGAWVRRGGAGHRILVAVAAAAALLSKPTAVTLPFALLLLDGWPLRRKDPFLRRVREKALLFAMAIACAVGTYLAAQGAGVIPPSGLYPFGIRIANALVSYTSYLVKTIWPVDLAVVYPHPYITRTPIPAWRIFGSAILLAGSVWAAFRARNTRPYLLTGCLWYMVLLVPMAGIVQAGGQAMADRYTYLPLIGVFLALAWGIPDLLGNWRFRRIALGIAFGAVVSACTITSRLQTAHWRNGVALFEHAVAVTENNWLARFNLGYALEQEGRIDMAATQYGEAIRIYPTYPEAHINLGLILLRFGNPVAAHPHFMEALRWRPGDRRLAIYAEMTAPLTGVRPNGGK